MEEYHFLREGWYKTFVYGKELEKPDIANCFTPFYFVWMNMVMRAMNFDDTIARMTSCFSPVHILIHNDFLLILFYFSS